MSLTNCPTIGAHKTMLASLYIYLLISGEVGRLRHFRLFCDVDELLFPILSDVWLGYPNYFASTYVIYIYTNISIWLLLFNYQAKTDMFHSRREHIMYVAPLISNPKMNQYFGVIQRSTHSI